MFQAIQTLAYARQYTMSKHRVQNKYRDEVHSESAHSLNIHANMHLCPYNWENKGKEIRDKQALAQKGVERRRAHLLQPPGHFK